MDKKETTETATGPFGCLFFISLLLFFCAVFLLLLSQNMGKELNHDEQMYVSSGVLLARDGLLPYRDYPYFQMPYLVFVYAALFMFTDHLLLAARVLSTVCALLLLGLVFYVAYDLFRGQSYLAAFLLSSCTVVLLLANPIFAYTSGLAWNHDLAVLSAVAATVLQYKAIARQRATWLLLSGLALGFAVGVRLSFLFAVFPFFLSLFLFPISPASLKERIRLLTLHAGGFLLALLPALLMLAAWPRQFVFGNISYHQVNADYWQAAGYTRAMNLPGKLAYLWDVITQPGNLTLFASALALLAIAVAGRGQADKPERLKVIFTGTLALFLLIGALVPTPTWYQYFYAVMPLLLMGLLYGVMYLHKQRWSRHWSLWAYGLLVCVAALCGIPSYSRLGGSLLPANWAPVKAHEMGTQIASLVGKGKVLTPSPISPLEGQLDIYKQFATGPFAWRSASLIGSPTRRELGVISPDELNSLLQSDPPAAILTGDEANLEEPLTNYARQHGYKPLQLSGPMTLWLPSR